MSRWVAVIVVLLIVVIGGGFLVTFIQKARVEANLTTSRNNLRQLALFAAHHADPRSAAKSAKLPIEIPSATVVLPGVPPEDRLSWIVPVLPGLDQRKNPIEGLLAQIDMSQPWTSERNQKAARITLNVLLCPQNTPSTQPDMPAITCYVGIAGVGLDAASIAVPASGPTPPKAGAFHYDLPTPFDRITDGLSQTLLMGESADEPGSWLRGGKSTVRGLDDSADAKPLIGFGGQFGGFFPSGANFAMCDGSARLFTPQTTPSILLKLATIAGGENEAVLE
jgi:prepilin-type processing-associated H-X9-DG protein